MIARPFARGLVICALAMMPGADLRALDQMALRLDGREDPDLAKTLRQATVLADLAGKQDATAADVVTAARGDYARVVEALYAQGYYGAEVRVLLDGREAALIDPFYEPGQVRTAEIVVKTGRRFRFGKAKIVPLARPGAPVGGFARGQPAYATVVRDAADRAVEDWREAGHAKADVARQEVLARHGAAELDVDIALAPGPRVRFGNVSVAGETRVKPGRVVRIAGLPEGEVFSPKDVAKAEARLRKTGTFTSAQVREMEQVNPDGTLDMEITVIDRKPRRIGGGVEFSNFDGLTLSGYWLHRNILRGAERFRVDGEIAQIDGTGSGTDYSLSFRFEKPAVYGPDTLFFTEFGLYWTDEPDYLEKKVELTFGASQEFSEHLIGELGVGYSYTEVTDRFAVPVTTRELQLFSLPGALTFDNRDVKLDPTKGFYLKGEITPFFERLGGDAGLHLTFDGRAYRKLGEGGTVAAGRVQLGALLGPSAMDALPSFLFYSGGGGTVRGQPYKSLDADYGGTRLGGTSFAAVSGELRFPVSENFGLVAFADAGFVGADTFADGDWHAGAGLGVRYKTPLGPIRLDVAGPVAGDTGNGIQLYVGIGQAF